jgi:hypothetical protein
MSMQTDRRVGGVGSVARRAADRLCPRAGPLAATLSGANRAGSGHLEPEAVMHSQTILVARADNDRRDALAAQLDADGRTVHAADSAATTCTKLASHAIDPRA